MNLRLDELLTVTFTLFAVIDIVGSVPLLIGLKKKMSGITPQQEQQSYMGLPQGQRAYTPAPWSIGDVDAQVARLARLGA